MKKMATVLLLVLLAASVFAQVTEEWKVYFEDEGFYSYGKSVMVDNVGNVYVAGERSVEEGFYRYLTVKYNSTGEEQWSMLCSDSDMICGFIHSSACGCNGDVYVAGVVDHNCENVTSSIAIVKYNSSGEELWVAYCTDSNYRYDYTVSMVLDDADNIYIVGASRIRDVSNTTGCVIAKYNSSGEEQWVVHQDSLGYHHKVCHYAIALDNDGNVCITGGKQHKLLDDTYPYYFVTMQFNSAGEKQWEAEWGGCGDVLATSIAVDVANNVYLTGGNSTDKQITIKYSSLGEELWMCCDAGRIGQAIVLDSANNVYTAGIYATIKYDSLSTRQWYISQDYDEVVSIALDDSGNVYVAGNIRRSDSTAIVRYNSLGQEQWIVRCDLEFSSLFLDGKNNVYVTGHSNDHMCTIKYSQGKEIGISETLITEVPLTQEYFSQLGSTFRLDYENYNRGISVEVFNASGQKIGTVRQATPSGFIVWGTKQPSGVYFVHIVETALNYRVVILN